MGSGARGSEMLGKEGEPKELPFWPRAETGDRMAALLRELVTELPSTETFEALRLKIPMASS